MSSICSLILRQRLLWQSTIAQTVGCLPKFIYGAAIVLMGGCWSYPETPGTWTGTVNPKSVFVGEKICPVAYLKVKRGTDLSKVGLGDPCLVDSEDHAIDPSSIPANSVITVSGSAVMAEIQDSGNGLATPNKGILAPQLTIQVANIKDASGAVVQTRLAASSIVPHSPLSTAP